MLVDCFYWDTCNVKNTVEINLTDIRVKMLNMLKMVNSFAYLLTE